MASTTFIPTTPAQDDIAVANNGWFPGLSVNTFATAMRVIDVEPDVMAVRLREAMIGVNRALSDWQNAQTATRLSEVPAEQYGDETELEVLYRTAVHYRAKRLLIEQQRNLDTHRSGQQRADVMAPAIDDLQLEEDRALRSIRGEKGAIRVSLL